MVCSVGVPPCYCLIVLDKYTRNVRASTSSAVAVDCKRILYAHAFIHLPVAEVF